MQSHAERNGDHRRKSCQVAHRRVSRTSQVSEPTNGLSDLLGANVIKVDIANEQSNHVFEVELLQEAVRIVLAGEAVTEGDVSVAIVDDATIHVLNRKYLEHDYATDVLSFLLSTPGEPLEGEVIVSADTAAREGVRFGWTDVDELLLYVVHGTLHLVGYDDRSDSERATMRAKESQYLRALGRQPIEKDSDSTTCTLPSSQPPIQGKATS
ncbi:MAG: rRNA maturation RNase YbeY [Planctomycetes bacterium]|nr:rRNA maturation RNase YbeY [Planctomycetota bacterium]